MWGRPASWLCFPRHEALSGAGDLAQKVGGGLQYQYVA